MTYQEAIKVLVNATYSDEWQGNEDVTTAQHMAVNALEKQIPMKPKRVDDGSFYWFECPVCGEGAMPSENCYCGFCGQKLDWGDEE